MSQESEIKVFFKVRQKLNQPQIENEAEINASQSDKMLDEEEKEFIEENQQGSQIKSDINEYKSPFRLPTDEEVFLYTQNEKQRKAEEKSVKEKQKIWDKKTFSTANPLHHYKKFQTQDDDSKSSSKYQYSTKDKDLINSAMDIIQQRKKDKIEGKKKVESVVEMLEQKKEMFLVTMSQGIIEHEISRLQQISEEKSKALEESLKMLEKDNENFNIYLEQSKMAAENAQKMADDEAKDKKSKEVTIKQINTKLTSLRADISRNEELVSTYKEHKEFLDKLALKDLTFATEKEQKKIAFINSLKKKYPLWNAEIQEVIQEQKQANQLSGQKKVVSTVSQQVQQKNQQILQEKSNFNEEIEDFEDNYKMFFKDPKQLVNIFEGLEEKNLFLIQSTQDADQNLQEINTKHTETILRLDSQYKSLKEQKENLRKVYDGIVQKIKMLQSKGYDNQKANVREDKMKKIKQQLIEIYKNFAEDLGGQGNLEGKNTLNLLTMIEIHLNKQLKKINELKKTSIKTQVDKFRKQLEDERKSQQKAIKFKEDQLEKARKDEKNLQRLMQPSQKIMHRMDMIRSNPMDDESSSNDDQEIDPNLEDEKKYFQE